MTSNTTPDTIPAVRFAPSPTGYLHVGNARIALLNWLFARQLGGSFTLRLDDTDSDRSTSEFTTAIEDDLRWLGLKWDRRARQSERLEGYRAAIGKLREAGRVYPCFETPDELAEKRRQLRARGKPPVYDRAALALSDEEQRSFEAQGRRPHWRFLLDGHEVAWGDLVRGRCAINVSNLSDPVLLREDGRPLFTLTSVVDDIDLGISHVIRGEDHVTNTAVQIQIFAALEGKTPLFAHLPLLLDENGKSLSKRLGSMTVRGLRDDGIEAMAVNSLLARLGASDSAAPCSLLDDLLGGFELARFGRAAARFDGAELVRLNARLLHAMPFDEASVRLRQIGLAGADEAFWLAIRPNLERFNDVRYWWRVCRGDIEPVVEDAAFIEKAAALLPAEPWDGATFRNWTESLKEATGRKGAALFHPLRLALTGLPRGPELKDLLPLIGRDRAQARLKGQV
jgi:glutamyl-tRNA synthetase